MFVDITLKVYPNKDNEYENMNRKHLSGHIGTHFDVMDKQFPLEYIRRNGIIFDVSDIKDRDVDINDIDISEVKEDMFVGFYTGHIEKYEYGSKSYHSLHPQLTYELVDALLERKISIIGIDFPGVRMHKEHTPMDQYCADRNVFIVENLCNLNKIIGKAVINTYPMNFGGMSGLPCRVVAEI